MKRRAGGGRAAPSASPAFTSALARSSLLHSLLMHLFYARHVLAHPLFYALVRPARLGDWGVAFNTAAMLLVTTWLLLLSVLLVAAASGSAGSSSANRPVCSSGPAGCRGSTATAAAAAADPRGSCSTTTYLSSGSSSNCSWGNASAASEVSFLPVRKPQPPLEANGSTQLPHHPHQHQHPQQHQHQRQVVLLPPPPGTASVCRAAELAWRVWLRCRTAALTVTPLQSWCVALPLTLLLHSTRHGCCAPNGAAGCAVAGASSCGGVGAAAARTYGGAQQGTTLPAAPQQLLLLPPSMPSSPSSAPRGCIYSVHPSYSCSSCGPCSSICSSSWRLLGSYQLVVGAVRRPVWDMALTALLMDGMRLRFRHMAAVSLLRATAVSLTAAFVQVREAAAASLPDAPDVTAATTAAAAATTAAAAAGGLTEAPAAAAPLHHLATEWARAALRHLAVLLPLACVPLAYWWWSEQRLRRRLTLAAEAAAAAADTATSTAAGAAGGEHEHNSSNTSTSSTGNPLTTRQRAMAFVSDGAVSPSPNLLAPKPAAADSSKPTRTVGNSPGMGSPFGLQPNTTKHTIAASVAGPSGSASLSAGGSGSWGAGAGAVAAAAAAAASARPSRLTSAYSSGALSCSHAQDLPMSVLLTSADSSLSNGSGTSCQNPGSGVGGGGGGISSGGGSSTGGAACRGASGGSSSATAPAAAVSAMAELLRSDFASAMSSCSWLSDDETITSGSVLGGGGDDNYGGPAAGAGLDLPPPHLLLSAGALMMPPPLPRRSLDSFLARAPPAAGAVTGVTCYNGRGKERGGSAPSARLGSAAAAAVAGSVKTEPVAAVEAATASGSDGSVAKHTPTALSTRSCGVGTGGGSVPPAASSPPLKASTAVAAPAAGMEPLASAAAEPAAAPSAAVPTEVAGSLAPAPAADGDGASGLRAAITPQLAAAAAAVPATPPAAAAEVVPRHPSPERAPFLPPAAPPSTPGGVDATVLAQPVLRGTLHARPAAAVAAVGKNLAGRSAAVAGRLRPLGGAGGVRLLQSGGRHAAVTPATAAPYVGLTCMRAFSVKVRNPTGTHEEYASRLAAAVTPLILPPGIAAARLPPHQLPAAAPAAAASPSAALTAGGGPITPNCLLPSRAAASIVTSGSGTAINLPAGDAQAPAAPTRAVAGLASSLTAIDTTSTHTAAQGTPAPPVPQPLAAYHHHVLLGSTATVTATVTAASPVPVPVPAPCLTGGYVVVQGCVQLIAWVRGVDGAMEQRVVELNEEMAAALGLDAAAVAALMRQQQQQQQQQQQLLLQQAPQRALPPLLEAAGSTPGEAQEAAAAADLAPLRAMAATAAAVPSAIATSAQLPQALVQALPDASRVGQWTVQTPAPSTAAAALPPPTPVPMDALPMPALAPAAVKASMPGAINAAVTPSPLPHLPASPRALALPPAVAPAPAGQLAPTQCGAGAVVGAEPDNGAGALTIECAWTPCVPIAPASSPPLELELGLTSAAPQTLRLLLVQHGTLLADFTCVLGEGPQVLLLPVPPQPQPTVMQLVFAPTAGAATASTPLLYDIATLLAVPDDVASELAELSQVMRMEYGGDGGAASANSGGGGAAWRDHYAPLISDLAYIMERAELAAAASGAAAAAGAAAEAAAGGSRQACAAAGRMAAERAALAANAAADGPTAVLRVAQQLVTYLQANSMAATARFVMATVHQALQLHLMVDDAAAAADGAAAAAGAQHILAAAADAAPPAALASAGGGSGTSGALGGNGGGGRSPRASPRAPQLSPALGAAAAAAPAPSPRAGVASEAKADQDQSLDSTAGAGPGFLQRQPSVAIKLPAALPSPFSAAMQPWGDEESSSDDEAHAPEACEPPPQPGPRSSSPALKLPPALPSPFSAAMRPWGDEDDDGSSSADRDGDGEAHSAVSAAVDGPARQHSAALKLPPALPSPFSAAMQPWGEEESTSDEEEVGEVAGQAPGTQPASPPLKLPPALPSPFSAAMQPWRDEEDDAGEVGSSSSCTASASAAIGGTAAAAPAAAAVKGGVREIPVRQQSLAIQLPPQLPSPFSAAMQRWSEASNDGSGSDSEADVAASAPSQQALAASTASPVRQASQQIKLPRGLPSPFVASQQPWGADTSSDNSSAAEDAAVQQAATEAAVPAMPWQEASWQRSPAPLKLPKGLPSPFAGSLAPWPDDEPEPQETQPLHQQQPERQDSAALSLRGRSSGSRSLTNGRCSSIKRQASRQPSSAVPPAGRPGETTAPTSALQRLGSRRPPAAAQVGAAEEQPPAKSFTDAGAVGGGGSTRSSQPSSSGAASSSLSSASPFALMASRAPRIRFDGASGSGSGSCSAGGGGDVSGDSDSAAPASNANGKRCSTGGSAGAAAAAARAAGPTAAAGGTAAPWGAAAMPPSPFMRVPPTSSALLESATSNWSGRVTATHLSNSSRASPPFSGRTTAEVPAALCELAMSAAALSTQLTGPNTPMTHAPAAQHSMTGAWQQQPQQQQQQPPTASTSKATHDAAGCRHRGAAAWVAARRSTDDSAGGATARAARRSTVGGAVVGPGGAAANSAAAAAGCYPGGLSAGLQRVRSAALRGDRASAEAACYGRGRSSGGGYGGGGGTLISSEAAATRMTFPRRQPRISEHGNDPTATPAAAAVSIGVSGAASPSAGRGYLRSDLGGGLAWEEVVTAAAAATPGPAFSSCDHAAAPCAAARLGSSAERSGSDPVPALILPVLDPGASGSHAASSAGSFADEAFVKGACAASASGEGFARCPSLSESSARSTCCASFSARSGSNGSADALSGRAASRHGSSGGNANRMGSHASLGAVANGARASSGARRSAMGASLALLTGPRILQALQDSCLGYALPGDAAGPPQQQQQATHDMTEAAAMALPSASHNGAGATASQLRRRRGSGTTNPPSAAGTLMPASSAFSAVSSALRHSFSSLRRRRLTGAEAAYGLYHSRQALALDSWTLAYIALKALVCLAVPLVATGTLDRTELLLVGPHLLLRMLSFAPKAAVLLLVLRTRAAAALPTWRTRAGGAAAPASSPSPLPAAPVLTAGPAARTGPSSALAVADPAWAVAWREPWVLACGYAELLLLMAPMALGLVPPPGSLVARLRGLGLEVLMDGVQRVAFDQVRTWRRLPQHTLHCGLVYVLAAHQLRLPHAAALAALTWLAGLVTCLVLEVPRRVDFVALHRRPAATTVVAVVPPPAGAALEAASQPPRLPAP
ncbi:hypothetical protein HYH02_007976 [Chlamydomonas schloesseri]|uniref:Uncharacterized protein n=1 Tax=Chlamydomonas schloesseri TaxID=2026947 RepID=A0A835WGZ1_9CHLO|nr:hypothetical protein HYH02_007976 [Chlamydomonas schloesseri]|eukprot:KAG2447236.1 hypothetical protein HYH02_007976 [Chlamydomonas schloesseri]